jgi:hypothetical protein
MRARHSVPRLSARCFAHALVEVSDSKVGANEGVSSAIRISTLTTVEASVRVYLRDEL